MNTKYIDIDSFENSETRQTYFLWVIECLIHFVYYGPQVITFYYCCKQQKLIETFLDKYGQKPMSLK